MSAAVCVTVRRVRVMRGPVRSKALVIHRPCEGYGSSRWPGERGQARRCSPVSLNLSMIMDSPQNNEVRRTRHSIEAADIVYPRNSSSENAWSKIHGQGREKLDRYQSLSACSSAAMVTPKRINGTRLRG